MPQQSTPDARYLVTMCTPGEPEVLIGSFNYLASAQAVRHHCEQGMRAVGIPPLAFIRDTHIITEPSHAYTIIEGQAPAEAQS